MKKLLAFALLSALVLSLAACGGAPAAVSNTPAAEVQETASVTFEPAHASGRQNGERFEEVIALEGMEETVRYEHVRNDELGFEMDYDYESLVRRSEPERECFISIYDDPQNPQYYLEVTASASDTETVAASVSDDLSDKYEIIRETYELDRAGSCIRIVVSGSKGGGLPDELQTVYIVPAPDGSRVAAAHYTPEGAEGFGRRFAYLMQTFSPLERTGQ